MTDELKDVTRIGPPMAPWPVVPLAEQRAAVVREIGFRRSAYPKWIAQGRMGQAVADRQIACMEAVLRTIDTQRELIDALRNLLAGFGGDWQEDGVWTDAHEDAKTLLDRLGETTK